MMTLYLLLLSNHYDDPKITKIAEALLISPHHILLPFCLYSVCIFHACMLPFLCVHVCASVSVCVSVCVCVCVCVYVCVCVCV